MFTCSLNPQALTRATATALAMLAVIDVQAGTKNANLSVTATVTDQCTVSTAAILANEAVSVACSPGQRAAVSGEANEANGKGLAYTVKRVTGALTTYGPAATSRSVVKDVRRGTQIVTITF